MGKNQNSFIRQIHTFHGLFPTATLYKILPENHAVVLGESIKNITVESHDIPRAYTSIFSLRYPVDNSSSGRSCCSGDIHYGHCRSIVLSQQGCASVKLLI